MMGWARAQGAQLWAWADSGAGRRFLPLLALALVVRLCLAPYGGFFGDPRILRRLGPERPRPLR